MRNAGKNKSEHLPEQKKMKNEKLHILHKQRAVIEA